MRVIAGTAKGFRLKKVPGDSTRPIMDRVKENLFNILGTDVKDTLWLDLFAGTGQVGIEALSRGAASCVFVDNVRPAIRTIQANLKHTKFDTRASVVQTDAFHYLDQPIKTPFDIIFVAPPQYIDLWEQIMAVLDQPNTQHLVSNGLIIVQIDPKEYHPLTLKTLELTEERRYGNTLLCFYEPIITS